MAIHLFHTDTCLNVSITIDNYLLSIVMDNTRKMRDCRSAEMAGKAAKGAICPAFSP